MDHKDHKTKIIRQTETVSFTLLGDGTGDEKGALRQLNILAPSQEVIVRSIIVTRAAVEPSNTMITCDTFGNRGLIGAFSGAQYSTITPNTTFMVTGEVKSVRFGFVKYGDDASGNTPPTPSTMQGQVSITLEFRAYVKA